MKNRKYISVADFNAPFDGAHFLQGLGSVGYNTKQGIFGPGGHGGGIFQTTVSGLGNWPNGRSYWSTAQFRSPYANGYFQDNTLLGIEEMNVPLRQIPTWMYALAGFSLLLLARKAYKKGQKK